MDEVVRLMHEYEKIKKEIVNEFPSDKQNEIDDKIKTIYSVITEATMIKINTQKLPKL